MTTNNEPTNEYKIEYSAPSVREFIELRSLVGWNNMEPELVQKSLETSLYHVKVTRNNKLIAMARLVGDGVMYFYIQDFVVHPKHQRIGLGERLMKELELYIGDQAHSGATIALFAALGKESFYSKFGFQARSGEQLGLGMCRFITS